MKLGTESVGTMEDATKSNPRAASVRLEHGSLKATAGQRRHDLRIGPQPDYVNDSRSHLNRILVENAPALVLRDLCAERRQANGAKTKMRRTAAVATSGVITFGSDAAALFERLDADTQDAAFRDLADQVADRLGTSLHGLVVHLDESTIHAHFQCAAFNHYGVPLSKVCTPSVLQQLQDLTAEVMARHCPGIERGAKKRDRLDAGADYADTLHRTVRELHRDLPRDLQAKREELARETAAADAARQKREKNERLAGVAREKLRGTVKDEKAARKLAKNIAIYENRADEARNALADAEERHSALCADIERLSREVETANAELEAMAVQREAMATERAELEAERKAMAAERKAMAAERTELEAERKAMAAEREDMASEKAAHLDKAKEWVERIKSERAHLAVERRDLVAERAKLVTERTQVGGLLQRLAAMVKRVEDVLEAALQLGPRVRRILSDAEAAAEERHSARQARSEIVKSVPHMREARSFLTEARAAVQGEAQSVPEQSAEQSALDWRSSLDDFDGPG